MTQTFSQEKPNLVSEPIDNTSDISLPLTENLSLQSTPSITGQSPQLLFLQIYPMF